MAHMFKEGGLYRTKRSHMQDGQSFRAGQLFKLTSIHEVCEERVYYVTMTFISLDRNHDFIWHKSMPPDEETGRDLFEPLEKLPPIPAAVLELDPEDLEAYRAGTLETPDPAAAASADVSIVDVPQSQMEEPRSAAMPPPPTMTRVTVTPAVKQLAFSVLVPQDFRQLPFPEEATDFSDPAVMMPLGVFMASYGAVLFSVTARPGFGDGSLLDWAKHFSATITDSTLKKMIPERRWGTMVIEAEAVQPSEAGEMTIRSYFLEDGGNLINVGLMAPTAIWPSVEPTLIAMLESFTLLQPQGATRPIVPGGPVPPKAQFAAEPAPEPIAAPAPEAALAAAPVEDDGLPNLSQFALDDAEALNPDEKINARFRDAGVGLVTNVIVSNPAKKTLVIGSGATESMIPIPFGWHAVDDGRRTLIFDSANRIQINFTLIPVDGQTPSEIFTAILQDLAQGNPRIEHHVMEVEGFNLMGVRNLVIDGEPLQQAYMLKKHPTKENMALKIRVTANDNDITMALNLTGEMGGTMRFM